MLRFRKKKTTNHKKQNAREEYFYRDKELQILLQL